MMGLTFLGAIGLSVMAVIFIGRELPQWFKFKSAWSWLSMPPAYFASVMDVPIGRSQFARLCKRQAAVGLSAHWQNLQAARSNSPTSLACVEHLFLAMFNDLNMLKLLPNFEPTGAVNSRNIHFYGSGSVANVWCAKARSDDAGPVFESMRVAETLPGADSVADGALSPRGIPDEQILDMVNGWPQASSANVPCNNTNVADHAPATFAAASLPWATVCGAVTAKVKSQKPKGAMKSMRISEYPEDGTRLHLPLF
jgi:hypothetical protein